MWRTASTAQSSSSLGNEQDAENTYTWADGGAEEDDGRGGRPLGDAAEAMVRHVVDSCEDSAWACECSETTRENEALGSIDDGPRWAYMHCYHWSAPPVTCSRHTTESHTATLNHSPARTCACRVSRSNCRSAANSVAVRGGAGRPSSLSMEASRVEFPSSALPHKRRKLQPHDRDNVMNALVCAAKGAVGRCDDDVYTPVATMGAPREHAGL